MTTLKQLIQAGEHERQDFKMRVDDQQKIARTLVAFANTNGGRLLIGVKDNGKITGVFPEEEFHVIKGAAELFCQPAVSFQSRVWEENLKLVLEIEVEPNPQRFVKAKDEDGNWKCYVRVKDETVKANKILIKLWHLEHNAIQKPLTFKNKELECLKALSESQNPMTLSQLYKCLPFPKKDVDNSLTLLVHWDMVKWIFEDSLYKYSAINC